MRIFVSGLMLAGAIWMALPGAAQAEGKCSRNADELSGAMVSMMPDGRYCEMDDGARKSAEAEIAAYNNQIQVGNRETEAPADSDKSGSALTPSNGIKRNYPGTVYARSFEYERASCARSGKPDSYCGAEAARRVEQRLLTAQARCASKGKTPAQCRADFENVQYYNSYY